MRPVAQRPSATTPRVEARPEVFAPPNPGVDLGAGDGELDEGVVLQVARPNNAQLRLRGKRCRAADFFDLDSEVSPALMRPRIEAIGAERVAGAARSDENKENPSFPLVRRLFASTDAKTAAAAASTRGGSDDVAQARPTRVPG